MTLFSFCVQIDGQLYEASSWGADLDSAFQVIYSELDLAAEDSPPDWEWCERAQFDGELVWWLELAHA